MQAFCLSTLDFSGVGTQKVLGSPEDHVVKRMCLHA